jgi:hypothetical protein
MQTAFWRRHPGRVPPSTPRWRPHPVDSSARVPSVARPAPPARPSARRSPAQPGQAALDGGREDLRGVRQGEAAGQVVFGRLGGQCQSQCKRDGTRRERCETPLHCAHVADETTPNVVGMRRPSQKLRGGNGQARWGVGLQTVSEGGASCGAPRPG